VDEFVPRAVSVTDAPFAIIAVQAVAEQLSHVTPLTVPVPVPPSATVSAYRAGSNVAVTFLAALIVTEHVFPDAEVHPDHDLRSTSEP
jgi:hypothetical protein